MKGTGRLEERRRGVRRGVGKTERQLALRRRQQNSGVNPSVVCLRRRDPARRGRAFLPRFMADNLVARVCPVIARVL